MSTLMQENKSPQFEDRHTMSKRKRTSCMFVFVCLMLFNATFNNSSVISSWSVLLVEETGVPGESRGQTLLHNVVHLILIEIRPHNISGDSCQKYKQ
jgi:hypothetical protein